MERNRLYAIGAVGVLVVGLLGGYFVWTYLLPESATVVDEPEAAGDDRSGDAAVGGPGEGSANATGTDGGPTTLRRGSFTGKAGHDVSGTVELKRDAEGYYLRFENYRQEQGPDVFLYLTPAEDPDDSGEIADGRKILVDGGADGGEMTKVGNFTQRLPEDFDPGGYEGVAVWCDAFGVPFGAATLSDV